MNIYQKNLTEIVQKKFDNEDVSVIIDTLFTLGIIDYSLCKILCVREWINDLCARGVGVVDAMWMATEEFACTFEYARKCIYYYKDISLG